MYASRFAFLATGLGVASGAALPTLSTRQVDCQTPGNGLDPSCWQTLGLTDYVNKFAQGSQAECIQTNGFATCFLGSINKGTVNCNILNINTCAAPTVESNLSPEDFYVYYAIFAINNAFNSYYAALDSAYALALGNVPSIIQLLDPPSKANVVLTDVLTALSAGLGLVAAENPVLSALVRGASAVDSVAGLLFPQGPNGTPGQQNAELANIDKSLESLVQQLQSNINSALPLILKDPQAFLAFVQGGEFSQVPAESLFGDASGLLLGLNTYVISQCLQANSIIVTRGAPGTNVVDFIKGGDAHTYEITGCNNGYDQNGICDGWYYDSATQNTYALVGLTTWGKSMNDQLETIIKNYGVNGTMLLANAAQCADSGGAQKQGDLISLSKDQISFSKCLSNPQVCTWNQDKDTDSTNLFSDCGDLIPAWGKGNTHCNIAEDTGIKVPYNYIGPLWMDQQTGACRG